MRQAGRESAACPDLKRRRSLNFTGGAQFDPVLGRTYDEIAGEARSMHKCQGMSQLLPLPAPTWRRRIWSAGPAACAPIACATPCSTAAWRATEKEIFDGVDTSLRSLLDVRASARPRSSAPGSIASRAAVADARKALRAGGEAATVAPLTAGLKALRDVRASLASMNLPESARYEIDFRLGRRNRSSRRR